MLGRGESRRPRESQEPAHLMVIHWWSLPMVGRRQDGFLGCEDEGCEEFIPSKKVEGVLV